jgi:DNA mismatch endonuclease (patch repair protein)
MVSVSVSPSREQTKNLMTRTASLSYSSRDLPRTQSWTVQSCARPNGSNTLPISHPRRGQPGSLASFDDKWYQKVIVHQQSSPDLILMERFLRKCLPKTGFTNVPAARSALMAAIRGRGNRSTELALRMGLVRSRVTGWLLHPQLVPGKPDFFFPSGSLAVFVDGCFWHGCPRCGHRVSTRSLYWQMKLARNAERDKSVNRKLRALGYTVLRFWEHDIKKDVNRCVHTIISYLEELRRK